MSKIEHWYFKYFSNLSVYRNTALEHTITITFTIVSIIFQFQQCAHCYIKLLLAKPMSKHFV